MQKDKNDIGGFVLIIILFGGFLFLLATVASGVFKTLSEVPWYIYLIIVILVFVILLKKG